MKLQIAIDENGNKIVKVRNGKHCFTVQTNGNLPETHRNGKTINPEQTKQELKIYLAKHGTDRQRAIFNL